MFADLARLLSAPADDFLAEAQQLSDLNLMLSRLHTLHKVTRTRSAVCLPSPTLPADKIPLNFLSHTAKTLSSTASSTKGVSTRPCKSAINPCPRFRPRKPWHAVVGGLSSSTKKTSALKPTQRPMGHGQAPPASSARGGKSVDFLHKFFAQKSFGKSDVDTTETKLSFQSQGRLFEEDCPAKNGQGVSAFHPSGLPPMEPVPEAEYELSSYDEREKKYIERGEYETRMAVAPPLASTTVHNTSRPGSNRDGRSDPNPPKSSSGSRWQPSSDSNDSSGFFQVSSRRVTEINGKKVPDWAQNLDAVREQNLREKAASRHLEVFGRIDTRERVPLAEMFGKNSIFFELPSEGEDWSEDESGPADPTAKAN